MRRVNQLQPLSRQHHLGLHIGRHAKECDDDTQEITKHWQALSSYIQDRCNPSSPENKLIVHALQPHQTAQPEVASVLDTLKQQHELLNKMTTAIQSSQENKNGVITVNQIRQLAELLYDHVRFEERKLLPIVEKHLTQSELNAIYDISPDSIKHLKEQR